MNFFIFLNIMITLEMCANSQLLPTETLNNNVQLTAFPPFIIEGLDLIIDIECTFKRDSVPSMASVLSMVIAHSNKTDQPVFNYLALVNGIEGHAQNVTRDVEVVSGSINNNGESKLHMRFRYPETPLIGLYMCEVTGFDQIGKPVSIYSTVNILTSNITYLNDLLHNAQSNTGIIHGSQAACSESTHTLSSTLCTNYYPSIFYNGHDYYLSHALDYFNYTEMQSKCGLLGGYLIEVDTHDEFNFIRNYLIKIAIAGTVWTGATDEKQEGVYINEHNPTARPAFDWYTGEPDRGRAANCQCFNSPMGWFLADCPCYYKDLLHYLYICEVPR